MLKMVARKYSRRPRRKTRPMSRKMTRRSTPKNMLLTKRFVFRSTVNGSDTIPTYAEATLFQLSNVPAFAEITAMFEQYKITGIRYRWIITKDPDWTGASVSGTTGLNVRIMHVVDRTDGTSPGSLAELQQYDNVKEDYLNADRPTSRWRYFRPSLLPQIVGQFSSVSAVSSGRNSPWMATASTSALYCGLKWFVTENQAGQQVRLECYYYLAAKGVN